ncbi:MULTISPECIES: hypothetical protein [Haloarcula]|nr:MULTISPECIES: hypothetical protein [Halomicroarcula]MBX0349893.1 hypothetical protein [Halomicroarcula pellucida]MDS0279636.1 hypothetical protein [Halomicroarcula sp. S1AR25-4]
MHISAIETTDARVFAALGGAMYAIVVLSWFLSVGVHFSSQDGAAIAFAFAYSLVGLFLTAAVPLYLFGRFSLVSSPLATLWVFTETVSQWLYGAHPHPLSSYLTVWPILLGFVLAITLGEAVLRVGLDHALGRFGLRPVF